MNSKESNELTDEYLTGDIQKKSFRNAHYGLFWGIIFSSPAWLAIFLLLSN